MRMIGRITFGPLAPDQPDLGNPGLEVADNVIPRLNGYNPLPQLATQSTSLLASRPLGAHGARDFASNPHTLAGTATQLWRLLDGTWTDISRASPAYVSRDRVEFVDWNNTVIATDLRNELQEYKLGAATCSNLTTDDVRGQHIAVVRNQVVLGYVEDADGLNPLRVRWCALNNAPSWAIDSATLADKQDLREGEEVRRVVGGEYGLVVMKSAVYRMTFVGSPAVYQFDNVDPGVGTLASGSVIQYGARTFWLGEDGMRISAGDASVPSGEERIDLELLADIDTDYLDRWSAAPYVDRQVIVWAYPGTGNTDGQPNKILLYNWASDRWAMGDEALEYLFVTGSPYRSIDGFDDDVVGGGTESPPLYSSIEDIPESLDSPTWAGGKDQIAAIDSSNDLAFYSGSPRVATFTSGEYEHTPGRRTFIEELRDESNLAVTVGVEVGHRTSQDDAVVWESSVAPTSEGFIPVRVDDRYFRYRTTITGGFEDVRGLQVYGSPSSGR